MALDPRIETVRQKYELSKDDFWQLPQNKSTWLVKHAALEAVAAKAGIDWMPPTFVEANTSEGIAVVVATGRLENREEWSIGEASPKNNKNAYPWAMAEKRAKDRVILKLVGLHGLVYSEDEMPPEVRDVQKTSAHLKRNGAWDEFEQELNECTTIPALNHLREAWNEKMKRDGWNAAFREAAVDALYRRADEIKAAMQPAEEALV